MSPAAAVLVCALEMLGRSSTLAPVEFTVFPPPNASPNAEAFVTRNPDTIHLITSTSVFRDALASNHAGVQREACRKIASILVHEEWHLKHGGDERGAYQAQLMALEMMHAQSVTVTGVRRSMNAAIEQEARRRPAPGVLTVARSKY
jgi:hypothetical protein